MIENTRGRRRRIAALSALAIAALTPAFALAQSSPWAGAPPWAAAQPQGESTVVQELLVTKHLPGPALWRVSRGESEVVILGGLTPLPHMLVWDTGRVAHALDGANALLMPPRPKVGFFDGLTFLMNKGSLQLPHGKTLETALPPAERARFLNLMRIIHAKPDTYERWKPAVAGLILIGDYRRAAGLSDGKPGTTVEKLAQADHVPVRYVGDFQAAPYVKTIAGLSDAANIACFHAAMDDIDQESAHAPATAHAWANADLKTVGKTYTVSVFERCLMQVPSLQGLVDRGTAQGVSVIEDALSHQGKSVAVIDLNFLLRPNGVLDRLKAKGDEISLPAS
ncbi:MAG: TraB/GumN family protein [Caulobacteraceae bacterium]